MVTKPKKLIRNLMTLTLPIEETEIVEDINELNNLYSLKIQEELEEIKASDHKDIFEFVDLIQAAFSFARMNGFTQIQLREALVTKSAEKGTFGNTVLNNLNPENPSNALYFKA